MVLPQYGTQFWSPNPVDWQNHSLLQRLAWHWHLCPDVGFCELVKCSGWELCSGLRICGWSQRPVAVFVSCQYCCVVTGLLKLDRYMSQNCQGEAFERSLGCHHQPFMSSHKPSSSAAFISDDNMKKYMMLLIDLCFQWWPFVHSLSLSFNLIVIVTVNPSVIVIIITCNQQHD